MPDPADRLADYPLEIKHSLGFSEEPGMEGAGRKKPLPLFQKAMALRDRLRGELLFLRELDAEVAYVTLADRLPQADENNLGAIDVESSLDDVN